MVEGQGFEPWEALPSLVFKTSAFDRSATPPGQRILSALQGRIKPVSEPLLLIHRRRAGL